MSDLPVSTLQSIIFGDNMNLDKAEDLDAQPDPMAEFALRCQVQAALKSASGASVVLDLPLPSADGVDGENEPFLKSPKIIHGVSGALRKSEGKAFIRLLAKIREVFAGDEELMHETIEIVSRVRDAERVAMLKQISESA
jgi:hypothetical protein